MYWGPPQQQPQVIIIPSDAISQAGSGNAPGGRTDYIKMVIKDLKRQLREKDPAKKKDEKKDDTGRTERVVVATVLIAWTFPWLLLLNAILLENVGRALLPH